MNAFRPRGRKIYETKVPRRDGTWEKVSTGTRDGVTARRMDRMIEQLGATGKHAWDVLEAVTGTPQRWDLSTLYARWLAAPVTRHDPRTGKPIDPSADERIAYLRAQLSDVDLSPLVEDFRRAMLAPQSGVSADTASHYESAVRLLIEEGQAFALSALTAAALTEWLEEMDDVAPATVRKRGIGMHRFLTWLGTRGYLRYDPMAGVALPAPGDPLCHYLDTPDVTRLADAFPGQMRLFEYVLPGTAMEVSTALAVTVRHVSKDDRSIRAPGTKTYNRDRVVRVADFAWDAALELCRGKHPDARLFDQLPHRYHVRDAHAAMVPLLVEQGFRILGTPKPYTLRDHRHTWAVRAVRSGWPIEAVARQLGHVNGILALKVYGRFVPRKDELDRWEALASARDEQMEAERQQATGGNCEQA